MHRGMLPRRGGLADRTERVSKLVMLSKACFFWFSGSWDIRQRQGLSASFMMKWISGAVVSAMGTGMSS